jgi:hypothetical protein
MNTNREKLLNAAKNFGNSNLKYQQGSTREIFDYIKITPPPIDVPKTLSFFTNAKNHVFPFTNITDNQLDVGETFIIKYIWFSVVLVSLGGGFAPIGSIIALVPLGTGNEGLALSQWSWYNDNNRVLKNKSLGSNFAEWNATSKNETMRTKTLETDITIQPLIPFRCELTIPIIPTIVPRDTDIYVGCHVKGSGSLFAPKQSY